MTLAYPVNRISFINNLYQNNVSSTHPRDLSFLKGTHRRLSYKKNGPCDAIHSSITRPAFHIKNPR